MSVSQSGERVEWLVECSAAVPGGGGGVGSPALLSIPGAAVSQSVWQASSVCWFCTSTLHLGILSHILNEFDRIFTLQLEATAEWCVWLVG